MKSITIEKPWGHYTQYTLNEPTTIKTLHIKKGEQLSLQTHQHRAEHWIILQGTIDVQIGEEKITLKEGEDCYIKRGQKHTAKTTTHDATILEISYGRFNENDIQRHEDKYGRAKQ